MIGTATRVGTVKLASKLKADSRERSTRLAFYLYMLYIISFFLHLPARMSFLGVIRFDAVLALLTFFLAFNAKRRIDKESDKATRLLLGLFAYSILVIPLVEWPGSVIKSGLESFIKAILFYFFTIKLVTTERRLFILIGVFLVCNTFRVLEPLYLNITQGYWGSKTSFGWDQVQRLAGSPYDVVNSNGLAFIIVSVLPFLHYMFWLANKKRKLFYLVLLAVLLYVMSLTLSRSGIIGLVVIYGSIMLRSKNKVPFVVAAMIVVIAFLASLNDVQRDRYLSIVDSNTVSGSTAQGRIDGLVTDLRVALNRPIFGHGLGTSAEAKANVHGYAQIAHNLWLEVWQELGVIGLSLFVAYVVALMRNFSQAYKYLKSHLRSHDILLRLAIAMQVWLYMNLIFSLASYGLKSYEWYLFGGLSVVILALAKERTGQGTKV